MTFPVSAASKGAVRHPLENVTLEGGALKALLPRRQVKTRRLWGRYLHVLLTSLQRRQRIEQRLLRAVEHAQIHGDRIGEVGR